MLETLKQIDFFRLLDEEELAIVASACKIVNLKQDNLLFYEADVADSFYILVEGSLKLYKSGAKNNEIVLHHFYAPTLVAEMASLQQIPFPASAVCISKNAQVAILEQKTFLRLLQSNGSLAFHIIGSLTQKMKMLEQTINRNLVLDATQRVCALLEEDKTILMRKKSIEVANMLNMAPETLSRTIKKLRENGVLDEKNQVL